MPTAKEQCQGYLRKLLMPLGFDFYLKTPSRQVLEQHIFPYYLARPDVRDVASVGADWYNRGYIKTWKRKNYRVIENDPRHAKLYGGPHVICDSCVHLPRHFQPESLDLVFFIGVYGWGVDTMDDLNATLTGIHTCLRHEGELVFGWDSKKPERNPINLDQSQLHTLFRDHPFPPLGTARYLTMNPGGHTYLFLRKA